MPERNTDTAAQAGLDKILGEPIFDDFTENEHRIRRNLLLFSTLATIITLHNLRVSDVKLFLGLPIEGLTDPGLLTILFTLILYHLVHFWVYYRQYMVKWRVRLTGKKMFFQTASAFSDGSGESRTAPQHATLYSWWLSYKAPLLENLLRIEGFAQEGRDLSQQVLNTTEQIRNMFLDGALQRRLERFDDHFWKLQKQQYRNWIIFEAWLPLLFGIFALGALLYRLMPFIAPILSR